MQKVICLLSFWLISSVTFGQTGHIKGKISADDQALDLVTLQLGGVADFKGAITDEAGLYEITDIPTGSYALKISRLGYKTITTEVNILANQTIVHNFELEEDRFNLEQVVVSGTRTFKRRTDSPVIVNVISSETLAGVQACNLSEGLRFQPGLRVETDCQTCNYTQLRMNGLGGGYSQILINGRPIFSPLTGLYGMEQIPANMIERIEVVRGGGSVLYGSGAIGGTVNIITKIPKENSFDIGYTFQSINGKTNDHITAGNATILSPSGNAGATIFVNNRNRQTYDHNGDNFSELPEMRNNSFGVNLFFQPTENQKLEVSFSSLNEYRYGGEMVDSPAHLAQQSEERTHNIMMGSLDYQINFNKENSSMIAYLAGQHTNRDHYTGIFPDGASAIQNHLQNPPYGISENTTLQAGVQLNHRLANFFGGSNVLTLGSEYVTDDILDVIEPYDYEINQLTNNWGVFLQSDWEIMPAINLLTGIRLDKHNFLDRPIINPRVSLLYKLLGENAAQFRLTYATGFRAPQAFDADLHIAFAGGGISRITIDPNLKEERSQSFSGSINYDNVNETWIAGFTLEGFYTKLDNAFFLDPIGADAFGERFIKSNGDGSTVKGMTIEMRANYNQQVQLEAGFTLQSSLFDTPVENINGLEARREFLRTPNEYGYATFSLFPNDKWNTTLNFVYTGRMELVHFAGAPEQESDAYVTSSPFTELSLKTGYTFGLKRLDTQLELLGGIKNITNAYQDDFDTGKNRDSNYIYGPSLPRTFFVGIRLKSF